MRVTSTSTGSLTDALDTLNRDLTTAQRKVGRRVAAVGRAAILDEARSRRGSITLSGMGVTLGASAKITATPTAADVTLTAKPAGPWSIVEFGASGHTIRAKGRALRAPGRDRRGSPHTAFASVAHPGTVAGRVWDAATAGGADSKIERAVTAEYDRVFEG